MKPGRKPLPKHLRKSKLAFATLTESEKKAYDEMLKAKKTNMSQHLRGAIRKYAGLE